MYDGEYPDSFEAELREYDRSRGGGETDSPPPGRTLRYPPGASSPERYSQPYPGDDMYPPGPPPSGAPPAAYSRGYRDPAADPSYTRTASTASGGKYYEDKYERGYEEKSSKDMHGYSPARSDYSQRSRSPTVYSTSSRKEKDYGRRSPSMHDDYHSYHGSRAGSPPSEYVSTKASRKEAKLAKRLAAQAAAAAEKELPKGYQLDTRTPAAYKIKSEVERPKTKKVRNRDPDELTDYEKTLFERPPSKRHKDKDRDRDRDDDYHRSSSKKHRSRSSSSSRKHRSSHAPATETLMEYVEDSRIVQYVDERDEFRDDIEARFSSESSSKTSGHAANDSDSTPERDSGGSEEVSALEHDRMRLLQELRSLEDPPQASDDDEGDHHDHKMSKKSKRPRMEDTFELDGGVTISPRGTKQRREILKAQLEQNNRDIAAATEASTAINTGNDNDN